LTCYRYIELNPVRARIVTRPRDYYWSSFNCNAEGRNDQLITPHATYLSLGKSDDARLTAYRRLFRDAIDYDDLKAIREHVNQGKVLGSELFIKRTEATLNRRVRLAKPGRPTKKVL
jgi:putative transposase